MLTCPRCSKAAATVEDLQGSCMDRQTLGSCPTPRDVIPGKDIVLACRKDGCGKQFALPATSLLHRTIPQEISCMASPCGIVVVNPSGAPRNAVGKPSGKKNKG